MRRLRFLRSRLGISASWPEVPAGRSFIERHALMRLGALERPLTLEVIPSATCSRRETRATPRSFGPARSDPDAGLSVKYGVTSSATVEGTLNPDVSQVESDAFQVEINQRFPLFFSEKRPFFMEGLGTFELAGVGGDAVMRTAVHTRRIVDPSWGAKATGTAGPVTYDRVEFDRASDGERVYTVNVLNSRTTFQFDRRFFVRGIVQYDSSRHRILTDFLASWELRPGTVAYAGYGSLIERRAWDGSDWLPGAGPYRTTERGFFFKASYIHRFQPSLISRPARKWPVRASCMA